MKTVADRIRQSLNEAIQIALGEADPATYRVHVPQTVDVKGIRKQVGLSQREFAARFGFPLDTLRKWEQGTRQPEGSARAYLKVIAHRPDAVQEALGIAAE